MVLLSRWPPCELILSCLAAAKHRKLAVYPIACSPLPLRAWSPSAATGPERRPNVTGDLAVFATNQRYVPQPESVSIESLEGLGTVEAIAAVEGIDMSISVPVP